MAIPNAKKLFKLVNTRAINISALLIPNEDSVPKQLKRIRDEFHRRISDACGIGPFPIWFERQESLMAKFYRKREFDHLKFWIELLRYNIADWTIAKKKLEKAKIGLTAELKVPKRLLVKNCLNASSVVKKGRTKNKGWFQRRRAPLYGVQREYLLAEEGINWQVSSICLLAISIHPSLNKAGAVATIGDMDDILCLEVIHAILPLTERIMIIAENDDLYRKVLDRTKEISLKIKY